MPLLSVSKPDLSRRALLRLGVTLLFAAMGGSLFAWSGMPAGWLSGALVFTAIAALAGVNVGVAGWLRQPTFVVLGTSMGSAMSPDTLQGITTWPVTMLALLVSVPVMMTAVVLYLEKVAGWDRRSAFFAAVPGALSAVLAMAESVGADTRRVVFGQSLRLFALVALLPLALGGFGHQPAATMPAVAAAPDAASFMTSMLVGITGACLFERLKFPGGAIVGAMLASGVAHGSGLIEGRLPDMFMIVGFIVLGANTGSRFAGTPLETLKRFFVDALMALIIATAVTASFAILAAWLSGESHVKVMVAYVPGAVEAMTIMAFVLGLDPAFVVAHHLARFLGISLAIPLITRLFFPPAAVPSENVDPDPTDTKD
ncbi:MAG TPA: AbrB family transcriptional regulator [Xanthobacteraceae bacterium]|nr:AbrB family transcriptional regulator [Xanthobacteraceae bacterium]